MKFRIMTALFALVMLVNWASAQTITIPAPDNLPAAVLGSGETVDPEAPSVVIDAPVVVKVGDMIVVDVSKSTGDGFDWKIVPEPPNMRIFNNGQVMCAATGPRGEKYLFIISCAHNDKSDVKIHTVIVNDNAPAPRPVPDRPGTDIAKKVLAWCASVESPTKRDDALKLSQAFASLAVVIEGGAFDSPTELVIATKTANRDALGENLEYWIPLLDGLMMELKAMDQAGMLSDAASHAPVWKAVAEGLSDYAAKL